MADLVSERVVEQRLRSRIIEAVEILAEGEAGVQSVGFTEYFETFYDNVPHRDDGPIPQLSTFSALERVLLEGLRAIVDKACDATPKQMAEADFIATGWPDRVADQARPALHAMLKRGRFREDLEEPEPSLT